MIHITDWRMIGTVLGDLPPRTVCMRRLELLPRHVQVIATDLNCDYDTRSQLCDECLAGLTLEHLAARDQGHPIEEPSYGLRLHIEDLNGEQLQHRVLTRLCGVSDVQAVACWFPEGRHRNQDPPVHLCPDCAERYSPAVQLAAYRARAKVLT